MKKHLLIVSCISLVLSAASFVQAQAQPQSGEQPAAQYTAFAERCGACHALAIDDKKRWGPNLSGVFEREVGSQPGYKYGPYLRNQQSLGATWTESALRTWLVDSKTIAKSAGTRTKLPAQNLQGEELEQLIDWLKGLQ